MDYSHLVDELRHCARNGIPFPHRPDAAELWNATGGDGYRALMAALEYETALLQVKLEMQEARVRQRREHAPYAA
jgi:hypothetical protein